VAIAWTLALGDAVVPIPGTKRIPHLEENMAAAALHLSDDDFGLLSRLPGPVGPRY
jgi:aryl-alcohol dehydrogenase-like predicted oxidoreductase